MDLDLEDIADEIEDLPGNVIDGAKNMAGKSISSVVDNSVSLFHDLEGSV